MRARKITVSFITTAKTDDIIACLQLLEVSDDIEIKASILEERKPRVSRNSDDRLSQVIMKTNENGTRVLDVPATMKKFGLNKSYVESHPRPHGSLEHKLYKSGRRQQVWSSIP